MENEKGLFKKGGKGWEEKTREMNIRQRRRRKQSCDCFHSDNPTRKKKQTFEQELPKSQT